MPLVWFAALSGSLAAQDTIAWKTGPAFQRQLETTVSVTGSVRPLREALLALSPSAGVAVFLDRRIDPGQPVELTAREQPLIVVFEQIAAGANAGVAIVGSVVYIGPPKVAANLTTLAAMRRQDAANMPNEIKARLLRARGWQWGELAEAPQLLRELAQQAGIQFENQSALPHDLWPAASLPSMPWTDRLTLLLIGFDLTFEVSGAGGIVRLVPVPDSLLLEKTYTTRGLAAEAAVQLRRIVPSAKIRVEGGKLIAAGSLEDHDKIERLLSGQTVRTAPKAKGATGEKRYTLKVSKEPAGAVLLKVANQLGTQLKYDEALLPRLKQGVEFSVKDATLDELLTATLKPLGLTYRLTADALEVVTAE